MVEPKPIQSKFLAFLEQRRSSLIVPNSILTDKDNYEPHLSQPSNDFSNNHMYQSNDGCHTSIVANPSNNQMIDRDDNHSNNQTSHQFDRLIQSAPGGFLDESSNHPIPSSVYPSIKPYMYKCPPVIVTPFLKQSIHQSNNQLRHHVNSQSVDISTSQSISQLTDQTNTRSNNQRRMSDLSVPSRQQQIQYLNQISQSATHSINQTANGFSLIATTGYHTGVIVIHRLTDQSSNGLITETSGQYRWFRFKIGNQTVDQVIKQSINHSVLDDDWIEICETNELDPHDAKQSINQSVVSIDQSVSHSVNQSVGVGMYRCSIADVDCLIGAQYIPFIDPSASISARLTKNLFICSNNVVQPDPVIQSTVDLLINQSLNQGTRFSIKQFNISVNQSDDQSIKQSNNDQLDHTWIKQTIQMKFCGPTISFSCFTIGQSTDQSINQSIKLLESLKFSLASGNNTRLIVQSRNQLSQPGSRFNSRPSTPLNNQSNNQPTAHFSTPASSRSISSFLNQSFGQSSSLSINQSNNQSTFSLISGNIRFDGQCDDRVMDLIVLISRSISQLELGTDQPNDPSVDQSLVQALQQLNENQSIKPDIKNASNHRLVDHANNASVNLFDDDIKEASDHKPFSSSINQSTNQLVVPSVSLPDIPASESIDQSVYLEKEQSIGPSNLRPINLPFGRSISQSPVSALLLSASSTCTDQSAEHSIDQSIDESIDGSVDETINQSADESISHSDINTPSSLLDTAPADVQRLIADQSNSLPISRLIDQSSRSSSIDDGSMSKQSINQSTNHSRSGSLDSLDMFELSEQLAINQSTNQSIKRSYEELQLSFAEQSNKSAQTINQLNHQINQLNDQIALLEEHLKQALNQSPNQSNNQLNNQLSNHSKQTINQASNQSINQINSLKNAIEVHKTEISRQVSEVKVREQRIAALVEKQSINQSINQTLKEKLKTARAKVKRLKQYEMQHHERSIHERSLRQSRAFYAAHESERVRLIEQLDRLVSLHETEHAELIQLRSVNQSISQSLREITADRDRLADQLEEQVSINQSLSGQLNYSQAEVRSMRSLMKQMMSDRGIQAINESLDQPNNQFSSLSISRLDDLSALKSRIEHLEAENEALHETIRKQPAVSLSSNQSPKRLARRKIRASPAKQFNHSFDQSTHTELGEQILPNKPTYNQTINQQQLNTAESKQQVTSEQVNQSINQSISQQPSMHNRRHSTPHLATSQSSNQTNNQLRMSQPIMRVANKSMLPPPPSINRSVSQASSQSPIYHSEHSANHSRSPSNSPLIVNQPNLSVKTTYSPSMSPLISHSDGRSANQSIRSSSPCLSPYCSPYCSPHYDGRQLSDSSINQSTNRSSSPSPTSTSSPRSILVNSNQSINSSPRSFIQSPRSDLRVRFDVPASHNQSRSRSNKQSNKQSIKQSTRNQSINEQKSFKDKVLDTFSFFET